MPLILTGARFSVRVSFRMGTAAQQGLVIEQSPADGQAAPLSFVTITVGIATSMFTAWMLTRLLVSRWYIATRPQLLPV